MYFSSLVISKVTGTLLPIFFPLHKGWNKNQIQFIRNLMEPAKYKWFENVTTYNFSLSSNDHRHCQELYLEPKKRMLYQVYVPSNQETKQKVVIWFHGGGFVIGNIRADADFCKKLVDVSNSIVVNVNYGLAPENKFPKGFNDSIDAVIWTVNNIMNYGGNNTQIYLAGESTGGNLAVTIFSYLPREMQSNIKGIISIYPTFQVYQYSESYWKYANTNGILRLNQISRVYNSYLSSVKEALDPRVNPLLLNSRQLKIFPKTLLIAAKYDILYDDAVFFYKLLDSHNKPVVLKKYDDIHGFFDRFGYGEKAFKEMVSFLENN